MRRIVVRGADPDAVGAVARSVTQHLGGAVVADDLAAAARGPVDGMHELTVDVADDVAAGVERIEVIDLPGARPGDDAARPGAIAAGWLTRVADALQDPACVIVRHPDDLERLDRILSLGATDDGVAAADELEAALAQVYALLEQHPQHLAPLLRAAVSSWQLEDDLRAMTDELEVARRTLERVEDDYARLRSRRVVRLGLHAARVARPAVEAARGSRGRPRRASPPPVDATSQATVATIVLNFRHTEDTRRCLAALARSTSRSQLLVVVDNGATGTTTSALQEMVGARTLITSPENVGYAAGNNLGIAFALEHDVDFVWLLNPDAEVEPAALTWLLRTMAEHPDAGIVGPRILVGGSRPPTVWFNGGIIDDATAGATRHRDIGRPDRDVPIQPPFDVDYVTGACMLVRREVLEHVGLLPEDWFLYFEETEYNLRARAAGWRTMVDTRARVWHHKRSSGSVPAPYYVYYFVRNRLRFAAERGGFDIAREVPSDLMEWIAAWRARVARADPAWLATYDRLVDAAVDDARAGRTGPRADIDAVVPAAAGR